MATTDKIPTTAAWARWAWSHKGLGRWHRLFTDGDPTKTACSSPRKNGSHVAATFGTRPTDGPICPVCKALDDLVEKSKAGQLTDAIASDKVKVEAAEKIAVPAGACLCGASRCDAAGVREIRIALREQAASEAAAQRAANEAAFEAFLATKGTVKA